MGDSITHGARTYLGYPELAAGLLRRTTQMHWSSWNFAWNGFRAIDLLRAIDERGADLVRFNASLCTVMIGTNDAKTHTTPEHYALVMEQIILKAKLVTQNRNVLVLGVPALAPGMSLPYNASMNGSIAAYNEILARVAAEQQSQFLAFQVADGDLVDGVHLSANGVVAFAEQLCDRVLRDRGSRG
ncbi:MAG TPA: SGNH/GDSL hydrolase family protein [Vicinamibacterales bacterium]|jgi:lysophospholipase L1-like esterase|nr:SGNH/GDSL hydrolase family protein [Vicinamibacterales bacterium]